MESAETDQEERSTEASQVYEQILAPVDNDPHEDGRQCTCENNFPDAGEGISSTGHVQGMVYGSDIFGDLRPETYQKSETDDAIDQQEWYDKGMEKSRKLQKQSKEQKISSGLKKRRTGRFHAVKGRRSLKPNGNHWWEHSKSSSHQEKFDLTMRPFTLLPDNVSQGYQANIKLFTIFPHAIAG
ncbi:hypothetical protein ElyMa_003927600 [Elysia marginata]|uniref:CTNNB1 binding N-teminal domain-containing protein n=1 Tax=Elysia marginata TaxID=1093978 RepID=A0AAV4FQH7_9GAST|nr:hypothetical protein ElyMa_003927600 [Elysia marginata]